MKNKIIVLWIGCFFLLNLDIEAQCAMCKAVVEGADKNGASWALGLNRGILFLMGIPYLLMIALGILWYRYAKKKNIKF